MGASIDRQFHVMTRLLKINYSAYFIDKIDCIADSLGHRSLLILTVIDDDGSLSIWIAYLLKKLSHRALCNAVKHCLVSVISHEDACHRILIKTLTAVEKNLLLRMIEWKKNWRKYIFFMKQ